MRLPDGVKTVADRLSAARLNAQEDEVRRHILRTFGSGTTPTLVTLAKQCGLPSGEVREILVRLMTMDLLFLDPTGETVLAAYPFSSTPTPHRVRLMGREVFALCAVDALGIPAMLRETAEISSRCAHCHTQVEVAVSVQGLGQYRPGDSVVWFPLGKDVCCPVAQSRCPEINFFCSTQHRDSWLQTRGGPEGLPLTMDEAFEVGREIFGALLAPPESTTR